MAKRRPGPYQTQAAIAALHSTAATAHDTDWRQIAALYQTLLRQAPTPVVALNAAVATGMADGLSHALEGIARVEASGELARYHLLPAARADVMRRLGRLPEAADAYRAALALVTNAAERRFLERRLAECRRPELHSLFAGRLMCRLAPADIRYQATDVRFAHRQAAGDGHPDPHRGRSADRIALPGRAGRAPCGAGAPPGRAERPAGIPPVRVGLGAGVRQTLLVNRANIVVVHTDAARRGSGRRPRVPGGRAEVRAPRSSPAATSCVACCGSSARSAAIG